MMKNKIRKNIAQSKTTLDTTVLREDSHNSHLNSDLSISPLKKILFSVGMIFLVVLLFATLEMVLRWTDFGQSHRLFLSGTGEYSNFYYINPVVTKRYFPTLKQVPTGTNDMFLKEKPANGFRIFVLGGSSAAGYPYPNNMMFSRLLNLALRKAYPDKWVEVVNLSTSAINSWSLLDFTRELVHYEPDLVLIYAGHNEYYGALGIGSSQSVSHSRSIINFYLKAQRYRIFLLLKEGIHAIRNIFIKGSPDTGNSTLMEQVVRKKSIPFGSEDYMAGLRQFKDNLTAIISILRADSIPVMISDLVSNLKDLPPFVSIDGEYSAEEIYREAKKAYQQGNISQADSLFKLAKDYDALRFRAPEAMNRMIAGFGSEKGVWVVPMNERFRKQSPHGIIGNELILEHLHPNPRGYRLMAQAFWDELMKSAILPPTRINGDSLIANLKYYTAIDSLLGELKIKILKSGWPFKKSGFSKLKISYPMNDEKWKIAAKTYANKDETLEKAHVVLAYKYEKNGEWGKAVDEYEALSALTPLNTAPFEKKARILIEHHQFDRALEALLSWEKLQWNFYCKKWIGQIYLMKGKNNKALFYLQDAYNKNSADPQLLYNYSGALAMNGKFESALSILKQLEQRNPRFPGLKEFKMQLMNKVTLNRTNEKSE